MLHNKMNITVQPEPYTGRYIDGNGHMCIK